MVRIAGTVAQGITSGGGSFDVLDICNDDAIVTFLDLTTITEICAGANDGQDINIRFLQGVTHVIDILSLTGMGTDHVILDSINGSDQWGLNTNDSQAVDHVDVKNSDASPSGAITILAPLSSDNIDSGNNSSEWDFVNGAPPVGSKMTKISTLIPVLAMLNKL